MLETLREYASERLETSGETHEYTRRHAQWYAELLEEQSLQVPREGSREALDWFAANQDNLRAMLDVLTGADVEAAARAAYVSMRFSARAPFGMVTIVRSAVRSFVDRRPMISTVATRSSTLMVSPSTKV